MKQLCMCFRDDQYSRRSKELSIVKGSVDENVRVTDNIGQLSMCIFTSPSQTLSKSCHLAMVINETVLLVGRIASVFIR